MYGNKDWTVIIVQESHELIIHTFFKCIMMKTTKCQTTLARQHAQLLLTTNNRTIRVTHDTLTLMGIFHYQLDRLNGKDICP